MRPLILFSLLGVAVIARAGAAEIAPSRPLDGASIRGANYCAAAGHHLEHWTHYDAAETARDLDNARKIGINQVRVFLSYAAWQAAPDAFRRNLRDLARACAVRHIGLMPVVMNKRDLPREPEPRPLLREWVRMLVETIGQEPALVCWDVYNEPDYPDDANRPRHIEEARAVATLLRELDTRRPRTPVTIGFAYEKYMEENADAVDVLSFHDYSPTRGEIRQNIDKAVAFAAKAKKSVVNSEIGCTARANPYDVAIEEYDRAHVGFYLWELMVTLYWGNVHGVFYPDGTIRDPAIVAALLGFFRNRTATAVEELPDREGAVTRLLQRGGAWLQDPASSYAEGLNLAETAANLLEANELVGLRDLPTRRVELLRHARENRAALGALLADFMHAVQPYGLPPKPASP